MLAAIVILGAMLVDLGDPGPTPAELELLKTRRSLKRGEELLRQCEATTKQVEATNAAMAKLRRELGLPVPILPKTTTLQEALDLAVKQGLIEIRESAPEPDKPMK